MGTRAVHFVGSFPAESTDTAMRAMLDTSWPLLRTLPTGETRRYEFYIKPIIEDLVAQGVLASKRAGEWDTSRQRTIYRPARGKRLTADLMDLGYLHETAEALPVFRALCEQRGLSGLTLQMGMPTDFTLAFIAMGGTGVLRHRRAFSAAAVREIAAIQELTDGEVVIQLEATAELVLMAKTQPLHRVVNRALGLSKGIAALAASAPAGTRFGVHLCLGSMNNKARATLRDTRPLVYFANSLARQWPSDRPLEFIHAPFAAGDTPPATEPGFYRALAGLRLHEDTNFYAGLVHDIPTEAAQSQTLRQIEQALGRPVDGVATACGLGRRPRSFADELMARARRLAERD
ncbi:hypothetical protein F5X71_27170 [Nocardia brasiliensis]|uniref:Uncharacterized protein n=1 Tax=Nocardia brasiliensis TaxID=37326 RepID=A0A6G9XXE0_NOCBR|nr:hypothetical protein [Nocardia brasiliensis]QIS05503.1 hypothetical protein F5X71_27170 [Nocardia brasiliensis]